MDLYDQLIKKLHDGDIISVKKEMYRDAIEDYHCKGLLVYCNPLQMEKKLNYIKDLVGDAARVQWLPNQESIHIEI